MDSSAISEEAQIGGAKVTLTGYKDSLFFLTDGCRFLYEWPSDYEGLPFVVTVVDHKGCIPFPAIRLLLEFNKLVRAQPDILRVVGIAGMVWLDHLIEVHCPKRQETR